MQDLRTTVALVTVGCLLGAACGSGDSADADDAKDGSAGPVELDGRVDDHGTEQLDGTSLDLELDDRYFAPTFVEAEPGTVVTVNLENEGGRDHTFTIDDAGIDEELAPGADAEVEVTIPDSGALTFYCRFHRNAGMQGAFFTDTTVPSVQSPTTGAAPRGGYGY